MSEKKIKRKYKYKSAFNEIEQQFLGPVNTHSTVRQVLQKKRLAAFRLRHSSWDASGGGDVLRSTLRFVCPSDRLMENFPLHSLFLCQFGFGTKIYLQNQLEYSIVKDSSVDLGVNFKIVQNRPKAVCTKFSKFIFCIFCQYFYISERK